MKFGGSGVEGIPFVESTISNTLLTDLQRSVWCRILSRIGKYILLRHLKYTDNICHDNIYNLSCIGERVMIYLLLSTFLFLSLPKGCYLQMTGPPIHTLPGNNRRYQEYQPFRITYRNPEHKQVSAENSMNEQKQKEFKTIATSEEQLVTKHNPVSNMNISSHITSQPPKKGNDVVINTQTQSPQQPESNCQRKRLREKTKEPFPPSKKVKAQGSITSNNSSFSNHFIETHSTPQSSSVGPNHHMNSSLSRSTISSIDSTTFSNNSSSQPRILGGKGIIALNESLVPRPGMFYCSSVPPMENGLPRTHIFNSVSNSNTSALQVCNAIFVNQLSNVTTNENSTAGIISSNGQSTIKKRPQRVPNALKPVLPQLKKWIKAHKRCNYRALLERYCPLPGETRPAAVSESYISDTPSIISSLQSPSIPDPSNSNLNNVCLSPVSTDKGDTDFSASDRSDVSTSHVIKQLQTLQSSSNSSQSASYFSSYSDTSTSEAPNKAETTIKPKLISLSAAQKVSLSSLTPPQHKSHTLNLPSSNREDVPITNKEKKENSSFNDEKSNISTDDRGHNEGTLNEEDLTRECDPREVAAFLRAVCIAVIPHQLWGCQANARIFLRNVTRFVFLGRYETLTLHQLIQHMKVTTLIWNPASQPKPRSNSSRNKKKRSKTRRRKRKKSGSNSSTSKQDVNNSLESCSDIDSQENMNTETEAISSLNQVDLSGASSQSSLTLSQIVHRVYRAGHGSLHKSASEEKTVDSSREIEELKLPENKADTEVPALPSETSKKPKIASGLCAFFFLLFVFLILHISYSL